MLTLVPFGHDLATCVIEHFSGSTLPTTYIATQVQHNAQRIHRQGKPLDGWFRSVELVRIQGIVHHAGRGGNTFQDRHLASVLGTVVGRQQKEIQSVTG